MANQAFERHGSVAVDTSMTKKHPQFTTRRPGTQWYIWCKKTALDIVAGCVSLVTWLITIVSLLSC